METNKFGFSEDSKPFGTVNILGIDVEVRRICGKIKDKKLYPYFCAYAMLPASSFMRDDYIDSTFRKGDWVGVDTAHSFNSDQTEAERLMSALGQIGNIIKKWKEVMSDRK